MKSLLLAVMGATLAAFSAAAADRKSGDDTFAGGAVVSDDALSVERAKGEDGGAISCFLCTADGSSNISGHAFEGSSGVFTVVQNTGNQVFLNTITVVNVNISK